VNHHHRGIVAARDYLQRFWPYFAIAGIVLIGLGAIVFIMETLPPRLIVMATGAEGGAYHDMGIRYREILARAGVKLQLMPTAGAPENLTRLGDPQSGGERWIHPGWHHRSEGIARLGVARHGILRAALAVLPHQWHSCRRVEWPTNIDWSRGKRDASYRARTT
jgi:hypothetical protein